MHSQNKVIRSRQGTQGYHSTSENIRNSAKMSVQSVVKLVNISETRRDSGLSRVLGSMTKLFSKNIARSTDLLFLKSLVGSNTCIRHERAILEEGQSDMPVTHDSMRLIEQVKTVCEHRIYLDEAKELYSLISSKWLHRILEIHDELAAQIANSTEEVEYIDGVSSIEEEDEDDASETKSQIDSLQQDDTKDKEKGKKDGEEEEVQVDTFRVIGIRRIQGQCLGLTVCVEEGKVTVARILIDSIIDKQGLLRPGDVIVEANGQKIKNPEQLQEVLAGGNDDEFIVFKIQPSATEDYIMDDNQIAKPKPGKVAKFFVRALFSYDPANDNLLPCQDIGLSFNYGDVMEIVNWADPSWWQARKVNSTERPGLIPSQDLEERRQCFVRNGFNKQVSCCGQRGDRSKSKTRYNVKKNLEFDKAELSLYETVEKMPPFSRKTLVLVSPPGLGKQQIIRRLVDSNPDMFGTTIPLTSRPMADFERDGETCWFVSEERMQEGIDNDEFIDVGTHDNYTFGTTFSSVRNVMAENKLCIIDCKPEALKLLHNSTEYLPLVLYLAAPIPKEDSIQEILQENGRGGEDDIIKDSPTIPEKKLTREEKLHEESQLIRKDFLKYFDMEITYEDLDTTLEKIKGTLEKLQSETQWVPRNWVFS